MAGHHLQNTSGVFFSAKDTELKKSEHKVFVLGDFAVLRDGQENLKKKRFNSTKSIFTKHFIPQRDFEVLSSAVL